MAEKAHPLAVPLGIHDWRLIDLPNNYDESIPKLASHVKAVIADNERYHGRDCEKFYIGKSHVHTWKGRTFDPHKPTTTWNREAVRGRWTNHQKRGFNNLAVLTVVTRDSLPPLQSRNPATWKQQYTLALEQALITHFMFEEDDPRLENETTQPGNLERGGAVGYVVYLAMRFSDPTPQAATATHMYAPPRPPACTVKVEGDWHCPGAHYDYPLALKDPSSRHPVIVTATNTPNATPISTSSEQFPSTSTGDASGYTPHPSPQNYTTAYPYNTDRIATATHTPPGLPTHTVKVEDNWKILDYPGAQHGYTTPLAPKDPSTRPDPVTYTPSTVTTVIAPNATPTSISREQFSNTPHPSPQNYTTANTDRIVTRLSPSSTTSATTIITISREKPQPVPVRTRQETPPPRVMPKSTLFPPSPPTCTVQAPPTSTATPTPGLTTHEYPVVPSWGDCVKPCKCGSTKHKTIAHHTCPLRKPCKCGSTTHQRTNHSCCPLNPRNQYFSAVPQGSE